MDYSKVKPLGDKIIVRLNQKATETHSGIITPDMKSKAHHWEYDHREGVVLAVGPRALYIKEGDVVMFPGPIGKWLEPDLGDMNLYRSLSEKEVLGVLVA